MCPSWYALSVTVNHSEGCFRLPWQHHGPATNDRYQQEVKQCSQALATGHTCTRFHQHLPSFFFLNFNYFDNVFHTCKTDLFEKIRKERNESRDTDSGHHSTKQKMCFVHCFSLVRARSCDPETKPFSPCIRIRSECLSLSARSFRTLWRQIPCHDTNWEKFYWREKWTLWIQG